MMPLVVRLRSRGHGRRGFRLWFPVVLVWILLGALMLLAFPFMLIGALATSGRGPGWRLLLVYPLLASAVWHLGGLTVDVENEKSAFLIDLI
jgi:hypothetical protein